MNILYVTPYIPSRIRTRPYHLIRALLRQGQQVTLLTAANGSPEEQAEIEELKSWHVPVEAFVVPRIRSATNCLRALASNEPLQAVYSYHPLMEQRLRERVNQRTFDVVHVEHLRASRLMSSLRFGSPSLNKPTPLVYDAVDSISLLFEQTMRTGAQWRSRQMARLDLGRTRRYEALILTWCNQAVVTSARDKAALEELAERYVSPQTDHAPITVVSNGVDLDYFTSRDTARDKQTIVFSGKMSYHANIAAVMWFSQHVMPLIWARSPDVRFQIVGKDPPAQVQRLAQDPRIQVTGYVADLRPYLAQATVAVCPIRYAVGIQNKVLEAMAMGTPTVSTPAGCAALSVSSGQELLIADGEAKLADAVLQVLADEALQKRLARGGLKYVESHHNWDHSAQQLIDIYQQIQ